MNPIFRELDAVVLLRDIPESGLRSGDLGTVVNVSDGPAIEVEFVAATGHTRALITITRDLVRPVTAGDLLSVRSEPRRAR